MCAKEWIPIPAPILRVEAPPFAESMEPVCGSRICATSDVWAVPIAAGTLLVVTMHTFWDNPFLFMVLGMEDWLFDVVPSET